jgi:hypothetical protein
MLHLKILEKIILGTIVEGPDLQNLDKLGI